MVMGTTGIAASAAATAAMAAAATQAGNTAAAAAATDAASASAATGYGTEVPSPTPDHPFMRTSRRHATGYPLLFAMPDMAVFRSMWHKAEPTVDIWIHPWLLGAGLTYAAQVVANTGEYFNGNFLPSDAAAYFLTDFKMFMGAFIVPVVMMMARRIYHDVIPAPTRRNQTTLNLFSTALKLYGLAYLGGMATQIDGLSQYVDSNLYMQGMFLASPLLPALSIALSSVFCARLISMATGDPFFWPPNTPATTMEQAPPVAPQRTITGVRQAPAPSVDATVGAQLDRAATNSRLDLTPQQAAATAALRGPIQLPSRLPPLPQASKPDEAASGQAAATIAQLLGIEKGGVNAAIGEIDRVTERGLAILNRCREDEVLRVALAAALEAHRRQDNASASTAGAAMKVRMAHRSGIEID